MELWLLIDIDEWSNLGWTMEQCQINTLNRALETLVICVGMDLKYQIRGLNLETPRGYTRCSLEAQRTPQNWLKVDFSSQSVSHALSCFHICISFFFFFDFFYSGSFKVGFPPPPLSQRTVLVIF